MQKSMSNKPQGLRERKKRQTREDLLSAADHLFSKYDYSEITVSQIADMALVSPKTFFNYFPNKSKFLEEFMLDWLKGIGFWSFTDSSLVDCRSALIPTDAHDTLDWIVKNRRIIKMAMHHTDFLNFIYKLEQESSEFDPELHAVIRRPRLERIKRGQLLKVVRQDIDANLICNLYDSLRIDTVRRWLYLPDSEATAEWLHQRFDAVVKSLVNGVKA